MNNKAKKTQEQLSWGCIMKLMALFIVLFFCLYKGCSSCVEQSSTEYSEEYWRSVAREKKMREAGLDEFADMEKKERQRNLKNGEYNTNYTSDVQNVDMDDSKREGHSIVSQEKIYVLDTINGNKILNKKASGYYGKDVYYGLTKEDDVFIIEERDGWVKVEHVRFPQNRGWIEKRYVKDDIESNSVPQSTSWKEYNGSEQQKRDLEMIDEYMKEHPGF